MLAANGVTVMIAAGDEFTPTPAVSHAILTYNRDRKHGLADGIVITPSHNPPRDGGFKYNPPHGAPRRHRRLPARSRRAPTRCWKAGWRASSGFRSSVEPLRANTTHRHDYIAAYVGDLEAVIDMAAIRDSGLKLGVDPLGGAGVHYWPRIAERYGIDLTVVDDTVDPTFGFMTADWDGQIRMDPSSPYAMQRLLGLKDRFEVAFACDPDHDRHGIVTRSAGLMPPNHYLSVAVSYLFRHRPEWPAGAAVGKTVVTSTMLDRVAATLGRGVYEVPVGFKWFVGGLLDGALGFGGEESAGASFVRRSGGAWTTDKDGIVPALLAAEITARLGRDPGEAYRVLTQELGEPAYRRIDAPATSEQKRLLSRLSPERVRLSDLAGEKITMVLSHAPGNSAAIGGLKVVAETGWFTAASVRRSRHRGRLQGLCRKLPRPRDSRPHHRRRPGDRRRSVGRCARALNGANLRCMSNDNASPAPPPGGALHEDLHRAEEIDGPSDRKFGLTIGIVCGVIGGVRLVLGHSYWPWWLGVGAAFAVLALTWPAVLGPLNRVWLRFGPGALQGRQPSGHDADVLPDHRPNRLADAGIRQGSAAAASRAGGGELLDRARAAGSFHPNPCATSSDAARGGTDDGAARWANGIKRAVGDRAVPARTILGGALYVLGISAFYHDSAAALVTDGHIVAAAQEERFTRKKNDSGFPRKAIQYCLDEAGIKLGEVDRVVFYDKPFLKFERLLETYLAFAPHGLTSFRMAVPIWLKEKLFQKRLLR